MPNGLLQATSYLPTLLHWWQREPNGNIGINCQASGLVVVDVDPRNDGAETLHGLVGTLGELPKTVEALTGGGGQHILFQHPGGLLRASLGPGVDIKDAGYIVTPPSLHPSGRSYDWSVDGHPDEVGVAELPDRWRERMERPSAGIARAFDHSASSATDDRLRNVPAMGYFAALTGRTVDHGGWATCPFHRDGRERTPSFKCDGTLWSCFGACEPLPGQQVLGGNVYTLAGLVWGYPMPLAGVDFAEVRERLSRLL